MTPNVPSRPYYFSFVLAKQELGGYYAKEASLEYLYIEIIKASDGATVATLAVESTLYTVPATGAKVEIIQSGSYYDVYVNGVLVASIVATIPSYDGDVYFCIGSRIYTNVGDNMATTFNLYFDDITDSSIIGCPKVITEATTNLTFTRSTQLERSYPTSDFVISLYSLTNTDNAGFVESWTLPDDENSTTSEFGYVSVDRSGLIDNCFGLYLLEMTRDDAVLTDTYFYFDSVADPVGFPDTLFQGTADVSATIYDYANNGGTISPDGVVYLYADNGTDGFYPISYEILNTPNNFEATLTCVYGSENINETEVTFSGLTNYYTVELDGTEIGHVSGSTFEYTVTDWTNYTAHIFSFGPDLTKPGVYGYIKDMDTRQGIHNAIVSISNETWSTNAATDETGMYYLTLGMVANETYTISASASGYTASEDFTITTVTDETSRKDIYLDPVASDGSGIYYSPHYVRFIVTDKYLFERYYGANVTISGTNVTTTTQTTGTDGACGFQMTESTRYAVNTMYGSINQTDYIFPTENTYYIILDVDETSLLPDSQFYEVCNITIDKTQINSTSATIDIVYTDSLNETNSVYFVVGQMLDNGTFNILDTSSTYTVNCSLSLSVDNYKGQSYTVVAYVDHDDFGAIIKYFNVTFSGSNLPFTGKAMAYLCIIVMFVTAAMWGKADASAGSVLLCGLGWFFWYLDIFECFGSAANATIGGGLTLATLFAVITLFNRKRDEGGI